MSKASEKPEHSKLSNVPSESPAMRYWWASSPRNIGFWQDNAQAQSTHTVKFNQSSYTLDIDGTDTFIRSNSVTQSVEYFNNTNPTLPVTEEIPAKVQGIKISTSGGLKLPYPTWSLLGRNSCPDLNQPGSLGRSHRYPSLSPSVSIGSTRAHSQPPLLQHAKIAQRSSHNKIVLAHRRCRSIGSIIDVDPNNHIRPRRVRGDDFRSLEIVSLSPAQASLSTDEKQACSDLFRQNTRSFVAGSNSTANGKLRSPMNHPNFIWPLFTGNQSPLSRIKLLRLFSMLQLKNHKCHEDCSLFYCEFTENITPDKNDEYLTLLQGSHSKMRIGKKYNEDARYCASSPDYTHYFGPHFTLADGVGEWSQYGIDSGRFSKAVVEEITNCHSSGESSDLYNLMGSEAVKSALIRYIEDGYRNVLAKPNPVFGACTIITGAVNSDGGKLSIANIGDCSIIQLRRDQVRKMRMTIVKKSITTEHGFNTPKQLVHCPDDRHYQKLTDDGHSKIVNEIKNLREKAKHHGHEITSDDPNEASFTEFHLKEGDLLICGSDGVFDNLYDDEIAQLCSFAISPYESKLLSQVWDSMYERDLKRPLSEAWINGLLAHPNAMEPPASVHDPITIKKSYYTDPSLIAQGLVEAAYARGLDPAANVPFGRSARRAGRADLALGGKVDDTTCIAMWVVPKI